LPFLFFSLKGLPVEHRCPECAGEFDRRWRVFGGVSRWRSSGIITRSFILFIIGLVGWMSVAILISLVTNKSFYWHDLIVPIISILWIGYVFLSPSIFITVCPNGLGIGHRKEKNQDRYAWSRIGEIYVNVRDHLVIKIDGKEKRSADGKSRGKKLKPVKITLNPCGIK